MPFLITEANCLYQRRRAGIAMCLYLCALFCLAKPADAETTPPGASSAAAVRYRVVNLGPGELSELPVINASGQVAFSLSQGPSQLAYMFDGKRVRPLGTLGGSLSFATGINDRGQVSGYSVPGDSPYFHAFRWTPDAGMLDLGTLDGGESKGEAINGKGEIVGYSASALRPPHAFRWTERAGMEDLGALSTDQSAAVALNDSSLVSGYSNAADGNAHTFVWSRNGGIKDIGTLGGLVSYPQAVAARGEVAGYSDLSAFTNYHAFLWTQAGGMRDLGAGRGIESFVLAMSAQAHIAGVINDSSDYQRAMSWTAATGMLDLGTFGGPGARAQNVNNQGQVVGNAMDRTLRDRAFLWTRAQGLADLNGRLDNAPAGLVLDDALAISDNGAIVAFSNAGLVLLRPVGQEPVAAPVVGPIDAPALIRVGTAVTMQLAFNDFNAGEFHRANLQWGDATMETVPVTERGGAGTAQASHVYADPGVYTIIARVSDAAGNTTTVTRDVVVESASLRAAGRGKIMSPLKAYSGAPAHAGAATFRFVTPGRQVRGGELQLNASRLAFRSSSMTMASAAAGLERLTGNGSLNGKAGYFYTAEVASGSSSSAGAAGRFSLRIWHPDASGKGVVIDYDNAQPRLAGRGTAVTEGAISVAH